MELEKTSELNKKIFNNGETAIVYRTIEELDKYGKVVLRFEEDFNRLINFPFFNINSIIFH